MWNFAIDTRSKSFPKFHEVSIIVADKDETWNLGIVIGRK